MRLSHTRRETPEINVGPFADIAFLMIIFFILTATFVRTAGNRLEIPSGTTDESKKEQKQLTLNLKGTEIYFGEENEKMEFDELRATLAAADFLSQSEDQRSVIVDSGPDVPYDNYYRILMAISRSGGVVALIDHERGADE